MFVSFQQTFFELGNFTGFKALLPAGRTRKLKKTIGNNQSFELDKLKFDQTGLHSALLPLLIGYCCVDNFQHVQYLAWDGS